MSRYIIESNLGEKLKKTYPKYCGDCTYYLVMNFPIPTRFEEPSYGVRTTDEFIKEANALESSCSINAFKYEEVNEKFKDILKGLVSDYGWKRKKQPHGVSDVDRAILNHIKTEELKKIAENNRDMWV